MEVNEIQNVEIIAAEVQPAEEKKQYRIIDIEVLDAIYKHLLFETQPDEMLMVDDICTLTHCDEPLYYTGITINGEHLYCSDYNPELFLTFALIISINPTKECKDIKDLFFTNYRFRLLTKESAINNLVHNRYDPIKHLLINDFNRWFEKSEVSIEDVNSHYSNYVKHLVDLQGRELDSIFPHKNVTFRRGSADQAYTFHGVSSENIQEFLELFIPYYRQMTQDPRHFIIVNSEGSTSTIRDLTATTFNPNHINIIICNRTQRWSIGDYSHTFSASEVGKSEDLLEECIKNKTLISALISYNLVDLQDLRRLTQFHLVSNNPIAKISFSGDDLFTKYMSKFGFFGSELYLFPNNKHSITSLFPSFVICIRQLMNDLVSDELKREELINSIDEYVKQYFLKKEKASLINELETKKSGLLSQVKAAETTYTQTLASFGKFNSSFKRRILTIEKLEASIEECKRPHNFLKFIDNFYIATNSNSNLRGGLNIVFETRPFLFKGSLGINEKAYIIPAYKLVVPIPRTISVNSEHISHPFNSNPFMLYLGDNFKDIKTLLKLKHYIRSGGNVGQEMMSYMKQPEVPPIFPHISQSSVNSSSAYTITLYNTMVNIFIGENTKETPGTICLGSKGVVDYLAALNAHDLGRMLNVICNYLVTGINLSDSWGPNVYNLTSVSETSRYYESISESLSFKAAYNSFWTQNQDKWKDFSITHDENGSVKFTYWDLTLEAPELKTVEVEQIPELKKYYELTNRKS